MSLPLLPRSQRIRGGPSPLNITSRDSLLETNHAPNRESLLPPYRCREPQTGIDAMRAGRRHKLADHVAMLADDPDPTWTIDVPIVDGSRSRTPRARLPQSPASAVDLMKRCVPDSWRFA